MATVCSERDAPRWRRHANVLTAAGCALLTLLAPSTPPSSRLRLADHVRQVIDLGLRHPGPPSTAQIKAAAGQVGRRRAELGASRRRLAAVNAQLTALQTQAEVLTERYDRAFVDEQRAAAAYRVTQARLTAAVNAERLSQRRVAGLAAEEYESRGGIGSATAMLADERGPRAYLNRAGLTQALAKYGTDALAANQANHLVAGVFRTQAHDLFIARQAGLRAVNDLKQAVMAAVARQLAFVRADKTAANRAAAQLVAAQGHEAALRAARQAALAARQAALAARQAAAAGGPATAVQAPAWARSSGASVSPGDIAADWALTQLGKPYLWGGAGPDAYDCSGLTMVAWAHAGVQLLHWTGYQWIEGPHVPLDQLQRGDLVFYATNTSDPTTIHHVGMYIGDGMMVDAPYTGAFVRIDSIYGPGLIGAVRPAG